MEYVDTVWNKVKRNIGATLLTGGFLIGVPSAVMIGSANAEGRGLYPYALGSIAALVVGGVTYASGRKDWIGD